MENTSATEKFKIIFEFIAQITPFNGRNANYLPEFLERIDNLAPSFASFNEFNKKLLWGYIRDKIVDDAKASLRRQGNLSEWADIKRCLIKSHGEKLTPDVLIDRIRTSRVKTNIKDFYNTINNLLCRLNNKYLLGDNVDEDRIKGNGRIALSTFTNNLPEPARSVIFSRKPNSLDEAYEIIVAGRYQYLTEESKNKSNYSQNFDNAQKGYYNYRAYRPRSNDRNKGNTGTQTQNRYQHQPNQSRQNHGNYTQNNAGGSFQSRLTQNSNNSRFQGRGQFSGNRFNNNSNNNSRGVEPMDVSVNENSQNFRNTREKDFHI